MYAHQRSILLVPRPRKVADIFNVEGNLLLNFDYGIAMANGVCVLNNSPAFPAPISESALGMAVDATRRIGQLLRGAAVACKLIVLAAAVLGLLPFATL